MEVAEQFERLRLTNGLCEKYCRWRLQGIRIPPNQPDSPISISCEEFDRRWFRNLNWKPLEFKIEMIDTNDLNDDEVGYNSYVIATLGSLKVGIGFNVKHVTR
jgi:hypothetical protein